MGIKHPYHSKCQASSLLFFSLTRALEGGAKNALPSGFSRIAEKRRRAAPPFFQYLLTIEFHTLCENFNPRSPKVRSPGQVKVKNGFLTLRLRSGHTRYPIGFKPSAFHKVIDTYNLYISDFWYLSPEVRSISWPHHYKSMGENSIGSYCIIMRQNHLNPSLSCLIRVLFMFQVQNST